jgi:hypothetical protein
MISDNTRASAKEEFSPWKIIKSDRSIIRNMVVMITLWIGASFCYYLISYQLKYIKGDLFTNGIVSSISECFAYAISGFMQQTFGLNRMFVFSFFLGALGMLCLILINTDDQFFLSLFILGSKFGIASAFNLVYLGNSQVFPVTIVGTSYGLCGLFARIFTIFTPYVAEIKPDAVP